MQKLIFSASLLLGLAGPALADQASIHIPESRDEFQRLLPGIDTNFDNVTKYFTNPALKTIASNFSGSNCTGIASPVPYQWCVDTGARAVKIYSQPSAGGSYSWKSAFSLNPDGSVTVPASIGPEIRLDAIGADPTGTADTAALINAVIADTTQCPAAGCVLVGTPGANYKVSSKLIPKSGVVFKGPASVQGYNFQTRLFRDPVFTSGPMIELPGSVPLTPGVSQSIGFRDIALDGNDVSQPLVSAPTLTPGRGSWNVDFDHVTLARGRPCIDAVNGWDWWIHHSALIACGNAATGTGHQQYAIVLASGAGVNEASNSIHVENNFIDTGVGKGILFDSAGTSVVAFNFVDNNHFGIQGYTNIEGCFAQTSITNNESEGTIAGYPILNLTSCSGGGLNKITGNHFNAPGTFSIVDNQVGNLILGNYNYIPGSGGAWYQLGATSGNATVALNKSYELPAINVTPMVQEVAGASLHSIFDNDGSDGLLSGVLLPFKKSGTALSLLTASADSFRGLKIKASGPGSVCTIAWADSSGADKLCLDPSGNLVTLASRDLGTAAAPWSKAYLTNLRVAGLTGYMKANGAADVTAAATVPTTDLSGTLQAAQFPALTGDVTTTAGALGTTLASTITAGGPTGSATVAPVITYDAKGRLTAVSSATIAPPFSAVTGTATAAQGGTGQSSYAIGDLLYASGATALSKLADVATGKVLRSGGVATAPAWGSINLSTDLDANTLPAANTAALTGDVTKSAGSNATTVAAVNLGTATLTGTLPAANTAALTGDVTKSAGSNATTVGAIGGKSVSLGANLTTSGAGAPTLAFPASSFTYTYPGSSGTLALTSGTVASLNGQTGALAFVAPPQGRITLTSATPVLSATVSGATTVYYTPYIGNQVPLYDGTNFVPTAFAEVSQTTTDTTKSPAAVAASSCYDLFAWSDGGTNRVTRGPVWTNTTTRSAGTALTRVNGIWLNNASITNGPAASRGTYVGSICSNASSTIDFIFGAVAAGGTAGVIGLWNEYNRVPVSMSPQDNTDSWNYTTFAWRAANASNAMRVTFVCGQAAESNFNSTYAVLSANTTSTTNASGIGYDSTNTLASGSISGINASSTGAVPIAMLNKPCDLGQHFVQAMEISFAGGTTTWFGDNGNSALYSTGLTWTGQY